MQLKKQSFFGKNDKITQVYCLQTRFTSCKRKSKNLQTHIDRAVAETTPPPYDVESAFTQSVEKYVDHQVNNIIDTRVNPVINVNGDQNKKVSFSRHVQKPNRFNKSAPIIVGTPGTNNNMERVRSKSGLLHNIKTKISCLCKTSKERPNVNRPIDSFSQSVKNIPNRLGHYHKRNSLDIGFPKLLYICDCKQLQSYKKHHASNTDPINNQRIYSENSHVERSVGAANKAKYETSRKSKTSKDKNNIVEKHRKKIVKHSLHQNNNPSISEMFQGKGDHEKGDHENGKISTYRKRRGIKISLTKCSCAPYFKKSRDVTSQKHKNIDRKTNTQSYSKEEEVQYVDKGNISCICDKSLQRFDEGTINENNLEIKNKRIAESKKNKKIIKMTHDLNTVQTQNKIKSSKLLVICECGKLMEIAKNRAYCECGKMLVLRQQQLKSQKLKEIAKKEELKRRRKPPNTCKCALEIKKVKKLKGIEKKKQKIKQMALEEKENRKKAAKKAKQDKELKRKKYQEQKLQKKICEQIMNENNIEKKLQNDTSIILDIIKLPVLITWKTITFMYDAISNPKKTISEIRNPNLMWNKIKCYSSSYWERKKIQMVRAINRSSKLSVLHDHYMESKLHRTFADPGNKTKKSPILERERKRRMKRRRTAALTNCDHIYLTTLRKKPCLWVYHICPTAYPQFLSVLGFLRNFSDILMFLLAVLVWTPCIVCMECTRMMLCCLVCPR